eukprot:12782018-Ditylum_brightwellii.AAC.1
MSDKNRPKMVPGEDIMTELLCEDISLVPATIDLFLHEGEVIQHFYVGNIKTCFKTEVYSFRNAK